jgi:hypothetical protein
MATPIVEGFSISHAAILDGTTGADYVDGDIYGIRQGSLEIDSDSYDNTGDDSVLSSWFWFNYANVTVQSGYVPFKTIAYLAGSTVTSSGTAPGDYYSLPLWNETMLNTAPKPMLIRVPSKDKDGIVRTLDFVLYKVNFQPFGFDGPSYKDGLLLNYSGRAVMSDKNERGQALSERAIGRLISRPSGTTGIF